MLEMLKGKFIGTITEKYLNDETLAPKLRELLEKYPLQNKEKKNVIVIEVENDIIHATICGRSYNNTLGHFFLSRPKEQKRLIPFLKELINLAKK